MGGACGTFTCKGCHRLIRGEAPSSHGVLANQRPGCFVRLCCPAQSELEELEGRRGRQVSLRGPDGTFPGVSPWILYIFREALSRGSLEHLWSSLRPCSGWGWSHPAEAAHGPLAPSDQGPQDGVGPSQMLVCQARGLRGLGLCFWVVAALPMGGLLGALASLSPLFLMLSCSVPAAPSRAEGQGLLG